MSLNQGWETSEILIESGSNSIEQVNILTGGKLATGDSINPLEVQSITIGKDDGKGELIISGVSASGIESLASINLKLYIGDGGEGSVFITDQGQLHTYVTKDKMRQTPQKKAGTRSA